ncbi:MAG: hypothetical protein HN366_12835 [Deltaproteobacteria bacterium]|nr:hypothetical protein [Deltaproteobacteria bacterium]
MPKDIINRVLPWCMVALFFLTTSDLYAYEPDECLNCHREGSGKSVLHMSVGEYESSVHHGEISCMDCHTGVVDDSHMKKRGSGNVDCGACHDQDNRHGMGSKVMGASPQCYSCHTRHGIQGKDHPASSVHPDNLHQTCGSCHPAQTGDTGFLAWLPSVQIRTHGKQDFACDYDEEDCLGCHQGKAAHGEETPLNKRDCRKCHFSTDDRIGVVGNIHPKSKGKKDTIDIIAGAVYGVVAALLLMGGCRFYTRRFYQKHGKGRG